MDENIRNPREDISYIRHILEKTADDMKTAAPWFMRFGIVWLVYGILCTALRIGTETVSLRTAAGLAIAGSVLSWVFYIALAVGYIVCRRRQPQSSLARKLVDIWGVCILMFIGMSLCMNGVIPVVAIRLVGLGLEQTGWFTRACAVGESMMFFVLPMLPLFITAIFLEKRRMLLACAVLAVFAAAVVCAQTLLMFRNGYEVGRLWGLGWTGATALLDILPGVLLLLFARALKRG